MAASAAIGIKNLSGDVPTDAQVTQDAVSVPPDPFTLWRCLRQLQNTVNEILSVLSGARVYSGGVVVAGTGLAVTTSAGEGRTAAGAAFTWSTSTNLALTAADATKDRSDLIQVATANGTISKKDGALVTTGTTTPVPAPDAGNVALASVLVAKTVTVPGTITDLRPRYPGTYTGNGASATNLFTAS